MKYYLIILLMFISKILSAQTIEEQKMFLRTISNHNENSIIPYVSINDVNNYNILNYKLIRKKLGLTKKQSKHIIRKAKTQISLKVNFSQIDSLEFREIKEENIHEYLSGIVKTRNIKKKELEESNDIIALKKLYEFNYHYIYAFSKPIYFNENKSCLIESIEYCGGCGVTKISIFHKIDNCWELIKSEITGEF